MERSLPGSATGQSGRASGLERPNAAHAAAILRNRNVAKCSPLRVNAAAPARKTPRLTRQIIEHPTERLKPQAKTHRVDRAVGRWPWREGRRPAAVKEQNARGGCGRGAAAATGKTPQGIEQGKGKPDGPAFGASGRGPFRGCAGLGRRQDNGDAEAPQDGLDGLRPGFSQTGRPRHQVAGHHDDQPPGCRLGRPQQAQHGVVEAARQGRAELGVYLPLVGRSAVVRRPGGGNCLVATPTRRFASTSPQGGGESRARVRPCRQVAPGCASAPPGLFQSPHSSP